MTFTESFRMERVYFEKLKSNITDIRNLLAAGNTEDARILLENSVDLDGAVLLLYRNLGECWAELADQIKKTRDELDALKEATEAYHDELNEKIDNVNFVLLRLINALDARLTIVENDLATMPRVKFLSLVYDETESAYQILDDAGNVLTYESISAMAEFPHFIVLKDANGNYYMPRQADDGSIDFHADGVTNGVYTDNCVSISSADVVTLETDGIKHPIYLVECRHVTIGAGSYEWTHDGAAVTFSDVVAAYNAGQVVWFKITEISGGGTSVVLYQNTTLQVGTSSFYLLGFNYTEGMNGYLQASYTRVQYSSGDTGDMILNPYSTANERYNIISRNVRVYYAAFSSAGDTSLTSGMYNTINANYNAGQAISAMFIKDEYGSRGGLYHFIKKDSNEAFVFQKMPDMYSGATITVEQILYKKSPDLPTYQSVSRSFAS